MGASCYLGIQKMTKLSTSRLRRHPDFVDIEISSTSRFRRQPDFVGIEISSTSRFRRQSRATVCVCVCVSLGVAV